MNKFGYFKKDQTELYILISEDGITIRDQLISEWKDDYYEEAIIKS